MQVFVREPFTMIAAPVQCDVDGVSKGSHFARVPPIKGRTGHGHCRIEDQLSWRSQVACYMCPAVRQLADREPLLGRTLKAGLTIQAVGEMAEVARQPH